MANQNTPSLLSTNGNMLWASYQFDKIAVFSMADAEIAFNNLSAHTGIYAINERDMTVARITTLAQAYDFFNGKIAQNS